MKIKPAFKKPNARKYPKIKINVSTTLQKFTTNKNSKYIQTQTKTETISITSLNLTQQV